MPSPMNAEVREPSLPPLIEPTEQVIRITQSGVDALTDSHCPRECDLCRRSLSKGDAYFRVTLGMDDTPSHVGAPLASESTVEDMSELIVCAGCEPTVAAPLEQLLAVIWGMRKPSPLDEDDEPTVPVAPETERSA